MKLSDCSEGERRDLAVLEARIGSAQVMRRLAREGERDAWVERRGAQAVAPGKLFSKYSLIRAALTISGLYRRALCNALNMQRRDNEVRLENLPPAFDGYTLLHLSDLHLDMNEAFVGRLIESVQGLAHDACVLTGDFRFHSFGPYDAVQGALARLRPHLGARVYAVLGNHDTIRMVPGMETLGMRVLMNESVRIERAGDSMTLAGIDDPRYYRTHDLQKAAAGIAPGACAILLSHAPEPYRQAEQAGFGLMLCGHTHGGQICLPGGIPILTDSSAPRAFARGAWRYREMIGYTSVGCGASIIDVRLNCLPEVTLHHLRRG